MRRTISIVATIALLGITGYMGVEPILNVALCVGRDVQIEATFGGERAYLCGSNEYYNNIKAESLRRLRENKLHVTDDLSDNDYVTTVMIARNDPDFYNAVVGELVKKYNRQKKEFDGSKMDYDFREQMAMYVELADIKCGGNCQLTGDDIQEQIYNLITQ